MVDFWHTPNLCHFSVTFSSNTQPTVARHETCCRRITFHTMHFKCKPSKVRQWKSLKWLKKITENENSWALYEITLGAFVYYCFRWLGFVWWDWFPGNHFQINEIHAWAVISLIWVWLERLDRFSNQAKMNSTVSKLLKLTKSTINVPTKLAHQWQIFK